VFLRRPYQKSQNVGHGGVARICCEGQTVAATVTGALVLHPY